MPEVCFCEGCDDLRCRLQQAQEERDGLREFLTETQNTAKVVEWQRNTAEAERDAAIERGKLLYYYAINRDAIVQVAARVVDIQVKRAEAAERAAAEQRALALAEVRTALEREIRVVIAATPRGDTDAPFWRGRLGSLLFVRDRILAPAEAQEERKPCD